MMEQYLQIKEQYKDCILFFRIGDFYEMFFEDAQLASKELELVLTGKDCGLEERAPMCGIPFHAADSYIGKLVERGYKVAICEQLEDPATAKGLVKRGIIRIVTPGTVTDLGHLDEKVNNYIMSIYKSGEWYGLAYCDISTGEFNATEFKIAGVQKVIDQIAMLHPAEIIYNGEFSRDPKNIRYISDRFSLSLSRYGDEHFEYGSGMKRIQAQFKNVDRKVGMTSGICASSALLSYIEETQKTNLSHINSLNFYSTGDFMMLDLSTRRNLELTETIRNHSKKGSLLWVLDRTVTAMGARMLRKWLDEPLISKERITYRSDSVEELSDNIYVREASMSKLKEIYDIERLIGKIVYGNVNARDLLSLKQSLSALPELKGYISECKSEMIKDMYNSIDTLDDVVEMIGKSIADDPPLSVKDGMIIRDGYDPEVGRLRYASKNGKEWIASLESKEREATGIKSLKVGYNKVFGYYIEVTNPNLSNVPEDRYIRKQTLSNAERYITPELKEMESTILGAEEKVVSLEYRIFCTIRDEISHQIERMQKTSWAIANLDVLCCLAQVASQNDYVKPQINEEGTIYIKDGRHPVVEKTLPDRMFVPNDTDLDTGENRIAIITGPNMAGKSTYMRQVALIVIMAQIGSFIPASSGNIGVVDRVFTRIGASDDLSAGQSTFMVEMSEVAGILKNSTAKSLILLDEVGRGTSTYDGLSIAWAVVEYISDKRKNGAKTLFATHYHELTELEGKVAGIKNYCISVKEHGDDIIFLRKIIRGSADQSYGIQVAKLAGLPDDIIARAGEILKKLQESDIARKSGAVDEAALEQAADVGGSKTYQMNMFSICDNEVVRELKKADVLNMTPIEAINLLYKLVNMLK